MNISDQNYSKTIISKLTFINSITRTAGGLKVTLNKTGDRMLLPKAFIEELFTKYSIPMASKQGTKENPWLLKTPSLTSDFTMYIDEKEGKKILVCTVGKTVLHYDYRCLSDLQTMLKKHGDWMDLGSADEQKPVKEGTVEAWGRSEKNPVGGWYGLKKGLRGRFGMYIPPLMEELGLAQLTHNAKGNKMKVK